MANTLLHSAADVVRRLLIAKGVGSDPPSTPWPIYVSSEPDNPDNLITVYDRQGTPDGRDMNSGEAMLHYGIQVRVRGVDHPTGYVKADEIRHLMAEEVELYDISIQGTTYLVQCFSRIGDVLPLGTETPTSKRSVFVVNSYVVITKR